MTIRKKAQLAIVGCGYWGKNLLRNFHHLASIKSLFDEDEATVSKMISQYPTISRASSFQEILEDSSLKAVVLATPALSHYDLAKKALIAGKHVFVEKPLALHLNEAEELIKLSADKGLVLMVDHLLQAHPAYIRLREMALSAYFGRILHINSRRLSFGKIRIEEDAWWSFAPHDVSMILGLMGQMPSSVSAYGQYYLNSNLADRAEARLDFAGSISASISVGWLNPEKEHRLTVIGEEKMAVFDDTQPWDKKLIIYPHSIKWKGQVPEAIKAEGEIISIIEKEPLKTQAEIFLKAIKGGPAPICGGNEALNVLKVLEAGARSMQNNASSITLNEMPLQLGPEEALCKCNILDSRSPRLGSELIASSPLIDKSTNYYAHPTALIDEGTEIGAGSKIWHFSHILSGSKLGENCNVGQNVVIGPRVEVGRGVKIQNNVSVYEGVCLHDDVFCGPSMVFTNVINPRSNIVRKNEFRPTVVKQGASIGANATIVCGYTLGQWSFIGAGAVVCADVPDHALVVGNPARRIGWVCRCGNKLSSELCCPDCALTYTKSASGLKLAD